MKRKVRQTVAVFLMAALLPPSIIATGKPIYDWLQMKHVHYDRERRVFLDHSFQHENLYRVILSSDPELAKKLGESEIPELILFGMVPKVASNLIDSVRQSSNEFPLELIVDVLSELLIFQPKMRHWLLRQVLVPCRLLESYGKPQVTRAP